MSAERALATPTGCLHRVAAVVLNYRTPDLALHCLETLVPALDPAQDVAVVVDNASGDGSAERVRAAIAQRGFGAVHVVESPENAGFSAGNNLGIRSVRARAYLLLNSDTLVRPGAVDLLWRALERDPAAGLVGPRIEEEDGRVQVSCFRYPTPWSELIRASRTGVVQRLLSRWDVPLPPEPTPVDPDWTSFCAVMIRAETLEAVGPLDEGFFMYFEDVDFCRRAHLAGFRIGHEPRARVAHLCGASSGIETLDAAPVKRPRYYYAARSRFFRKSYGALGLVAANFLFTLGRAAAWLRETFGAKVPHTAPGELVDIWRR